MPAVELKHVRSFSSEDPKFPAENILKEDGFKKWKCAKAGEKQASLVVQFEKAVQIQSIDIGNEGSAFVEVLVARASDNASEPDYQVLLVASSFMSPPESRSSTNLNRVRMFDKDKLTKSLAGQKWDLAKIVCTQPFNKNIQYGLSFIKFHAPSGDENESEKDKAKGTNPFGLFKMKEKPKEDVKVGSAFEIYKLSVPDLSHASARSVSKFADEVLAREAAAVRSKVTESLKCEEAARIPKRKAENNGEQSLRKKSRNSPNPNDTDQDRGRRNMPESKGNTPRGRDSSSHGNKRPRSSEEDRSMPSSKRTKSPVTKPFSKLMERVVFAMSGYQNPERGEIRDMACEMGATYRTDWGKSCTHLVCAFVNTPKFNAVKGKGRIVSAEWINRCYKDQKLISWRRFRVGKASTPPGSSDEEYIAEEIAVKKTPKQETPLKRRKTPDASCKNETPKKVENDIEIKAKKKTEFTPPECIPSTSKIDQKPSTSRPATSRPAKKNAIEYESSSDEESIFDRDTDIDEMDTDDEIEHIRKTEALEKSKNNVDWSEKIEPLPDFFEGFHFFLYGNLTVGDRKIVQRLVIAYNGELVSSMGEEVTHVVTRSEWDSNFDKALEDNKKLRFVKPEWIIECDKRQKVVSYDSFCVKKD